MCMLIYTYVHVCYEMSASNPSMSVQHSYYIHIYIERERERYQCINVCVCTGEVYILRGYKAIPYAMAFEWWAYQPKYPRLVVNMLFQKAR